MFSRSPRVTTLTGTMFALLACLALGCGGGDGTHRVSGNITFKGQPVPAGKIYFIPDGSKGNEGATGYADIRNGTYDTSSAGGKGAPAGAVIIAVEGIDPAGPPAKKDAKEDPYGEVTTTVLFPRYEIQAELPASTSTKDIDVPAEAAKGPKQPKGGNIVVP